ncbi:MAG: hypothetical protein J0I52_12935 [Bordetella sp.]|nr:hypothetical protein [Bordetella sp.]
MISLTLFTRGIEVGYDEDGFFAFGTTPMHRYDGSDPSFTRAPITDIAITWRIDLKGYDAFEKYKDWTFPASDLSPRVPMLEDYFEKVKTRPCGSFRRWSADEPISLSYSLPNDPSLVAFIMGAVAADREMAITARHLLMVSEDALAPAASVTGFMERKEPVFLLDHPVLRVK